MKKKLVICMLSATMALSLSIPTFAKDTEENVKVTAGETDVQSSLSGTCGENVKWNLNRNTHSLTITGKGEMNDFDESPWKDYEDEIYNVIIQNGVTSIGGLAFSACSNIENMELPVSVTSIGNGAFSGCKSLKNINIPTNVTSIGDAAFQECSNLTSIEIPNSVKDIKDYTFSGCNKLKDVKIPDGIKTIGEYAFGECTDLLSIIMPDSITDVEKSAFWKCESLSNVKLSAKLKSIKSSVFSECIVLSNIEIPESVTSIEDGAFNGCDKLNNIEIPRTVTSLSDEAFNVSEDLHIIYDGTGCEWEKLTDADWNDVYIEVQSMSHKLKSKVVGSKIVYTCEDCGKSYSFEYSVSNGEATIKKFESTFAGPIEIKIPATINGNKVKTIGDSSINYNNTLRSVEIPDGVTTIEHFSFAGCINLRSVKIPDSVTQIGDTVFQDCYKLTNITLSKGFKKIGVGLFNKCYSLESIEIPDGVTEMASYAFEDCRSLKSIVIPDSVIKISWETFNGCNNLTKITIGKGMTYDAFKNTRIGQLYDKANDKYETNPDAIIFCGNGSGAQEYAEKNNIHYELTLPCAVHDWGEGKITQKATCSKKGRETYTCKICGADQTKEIPMLSAHKISKWKVTKSPTVMKAGQKAGKCSICGQTMRQSIKKIPATISVKKASHLK